MTSTLVLADTSVLLNFACCNQQDILLTVSAPHDICVPEAEDNPGSQAHLIIDDGDATALAKKRGPIETVSTEFVLLRAVQLGLITNRGQARDIWDEMRQFDTLVPFEDTKLNGKSFYKKARPN